MEEKDKKEDSELESDSSKESSDISENSLEIRKNDAEKIPPSIGDPAVSKEKTGDEKDAVPSLKSSQKTVREKEPEPELKTPLMADDSDKTKTNIKLPKPLPHEPSTFIPDESDEPISSETISIKRSFKDESKVKPQGEEKRVLKIACWHCGQKLDLTELEPFSKINCPSCDVEIIIPKWFDNYLLEEPGGAGGMAVVYRALDLTLDREVAIKILNSDVASEEESKRIFLHEARTAATLNHYSVLPIYTCGESEKQPYIVMQYMDGCSLDEKLDEAKGKLPITDVIRWMRDIAEGLDNARRHGIIHHDVKPANIMLDKDGNVKIGDFGIAQAIHDVSSKEVVELTRFWSSPHYVSPEKVNTGKEDYMGDIYSLGATFYHLITGYTPFDSEDLKSLFKMRLESDPADPRKFRPEIPESIALLIVSMLTRSVEFRPSYRDIIHTLDHFIKGEEKRVSKKAKAGKPGNGKNAALENIRKNGKPDKIKHDSTFSQSKISVPSFSRVAVFLIIICAVAVFYLWKEGFFEKKMIDTASESANDYLPEVTSMLRSGDSRSAARLAETTLNDGSLNIEARKQAAIQLAMATYLNNNSQAGNVCGVIVQQLTAAGVEDTEPAIIIARYLSIMDITPDNLFNFIGTERNAKLLASTAVYLRNLYNNASENEQLNSFSNLSAMTFSMSGQIWMNAWKDRIALWSDWMNSGQGSADTLEPLIAANKYVGGERAQTQAQAPLNITITPRNSERKIRSEWNIGVELDSIKLEQLTADWLKKNRKFAEQRPRPPDYTFVSDEMENYLSKVSEDKRVAEEKRLQQVSGVKQYICSCMMRIPYESSSIKLTNGRSYKGSIMANTKYLSIRVGKENKRINWSELSFDALTDIMERYAKTRLDAFGGVNVNNSDKKFEAAWDYLRIGIISDWYGNYDKAVEYTKKAVSVDSRITNDAKKYLMY